MHGICVECNNTGRIIDPEMTEEIEIFRIGGRYFAVVDSDTPAAQCRWDGDTEPQALAAAREKLGGET